MYKITVLWFWFVVRKENFRFLSQKPYKIEEIFREDSELYKISNVIFAKGSFINDVHQKMGFLRPPPPCHKIFIQKIFFCMKVSQNLRPPPPKLWTSYMNDPQGFHNPE